jgi:hypothetical protein
MAVRSRSVSGGHRDAYFRWKGARCSGLAVAVEHGEAVGPELRSVRSLRESADGRMMGG